MKCEISHVIAHLLPDGSVQGPVVPQALREEEQLLQSVGWGLVPGMVILNKSCILNEAATKCGTQTASPSNTRSVISNTKLADCVTANAKSSFSVTSVGLLIKTRTNINQ